VTSDHHHQQPAGPDELLRLKREYLIPCVYHFYKEPPQIIGGRGAYLIDHAGHRYLDFFTGVTVMSAGHCNPAIIEPAIAQARQLQHTTSIYLTEPVLRLAEALAQVAPGAIRRSFFCASGSEAIEGALLLAALHTGRRGIVATAGSLHGRTRWAMNATGLDMWRTDPHPIDEVTRVPFGDAEALAEALRDTARPPAAFIAEPIQGNGGVVVPPPDYWPAARELCTRSGTLLVLDEVQTGFNRTGKWFACEHWGIAPDVLVTSKALGNGFPIAAFMTTDAIAASYTRPGASTYGGNPVSATAALATTRFHAEHRLGQRAEITGRKLRERLADAVNGHRNLRPPHGMGLMIGMAVTEATGGAPAAGLCDDILERLKDNGVLAGKTGPGRNTLTFMPPLTLTDGEVEEFLAAFQVSIVFKRP
jgi:4-aminobutyrate aminotransferase/4-aminobutyrate aminotransferase/(S)-3-amino-2-methylpropionate transaminase